MPRDNIALGFVPMGTKDKPYWHCPAHCPDRKPCTSGSNITIRTNGTKFLIKESVGN